MLFLSGGGGGQNLSHEKTGGADSFLFLRGANSFLREK